MMAGGTVGSGVATLSGAGWSVVASGDFNANGTEDILWKNDVSGETAVWLMGAGGVESSEILLGVGGWDLAATGDFNYDGTDDLLWKNAADGSTAAWLMSYGQIGATDLYASAAGYTRGRRRRLQPRRHHRRAVAVQCGRLDHRLAVQPRDGAELPRRLTLSLSPLRRAR